MSDVYSAEETGPIAAQCPEYGSYHVHDETVLLELLDEEGGPVAPGTPGRVVVTVLHNFAMPLLRYELGDYAVWGPPCSCGRTLPVLARIAGRQRNMLVHPDGSRHWPSFPARLWLPHPAIRKVQLVQTAVDHVEVHLVLDRNLAASEQAQIGSTLAGHMRWPGSFSFHRVPRIGRDGSHKFEDFISRLAPGR